MKPIIVGQAPSRSGDGTPFSGHSGARLLKLLDLKTRNQLKDLFKLTNLIKHQLDPHPRGRGDRFDHHEATERAKRMMNDAQPGQVFVACGRQVWKCMTGSPDGPFYSVREVEAQRSKKAEPHKVIVYLFPHPSGASSIWNYPVEVRRAQKFLRTLAEGQSPDASLGYPAQSRQLSRPY